MNGEYKAGDAIELDGQIHKLDADQGRRAAIWFGPKCVMVEFLTLVMRKDEQDFIRDELTRLKGLDGDLQSYVEGYKSARRFHEVTGEEGAVSVVIQAIADEVSSL